MEATVTPMCDRMGWGKGTPEAPAGEALWPQASSPETFPSWEGSAQKSQPTPAGDLPEPASRPDADSSPS